MAKAINQEKKLYLKKFGTEIGTVFLERRSKKKMIKKVIIKTKNKKNQNIDDFGYLIKKLTDHCCEVWCEKHQTVMILSQEDFFEIKEKDE